jgi:hypothetical protein
MTSTSLIGSALKCFRTANASCSLGTLLVVFGRDIVGEYLPIPWVRTVLLRAFLKDVGVSRWYAVRYACRRVKSSFDHTNCVDNNVSSCHDNDKAKREKGSLSLLN